MWTSPAFRFSSNSINSFNFRPVNNFFKNKKIFFFIIHFNTSTFNGNVDFLHRFIEASKFAYAARSDLGDINFVKNASEIVKNITSSEWAQLVR